MKVLILGSKGMLGGQLMRVFGSEAVGWDRGDCDVTKEQDLRLKISAGGGSASHSSPSDTRPSESRTGGKDLRPDVLINCVAYNDVDGAEDNQDLAFKLNTEVPKNLAKICKELGIIFVHFSSNYVFDGAKGEYRESDMPRPLSVYGQSKYQGELELQKNAEKFYLIRTAVLFGPKGDSELSKKSFVDIMLGLSAQNSEIKVIADEINSITYAVDLSGQIKLLLDQGKPYGIYHITNSGFASWYEFAKEIFNITGKTVNLTPVSSAEFPRKAHRPKQAVLMNTKLPALRPWQEALAEFLG